MTQSRLSTIVRAVSLAAMILALVPLLTAQSTGRFEDAKQKAQQYLDSNQFDKAAGKLEEVWEQDKTDATVAEYLALAYLNGDDRRYHPDVEQKAKDLMEASFSLGGKATFLVQHKHEGKVVVIATGGDSLKYCDGRLSISKGKLAFVMKQLKGAEDHSFEVTSDQIKVSGPTRSGGFTISRRVENKWKNYSIEPRNGNSADTNLILSLIREQLGATQ